MRRFHAPDADLSTGSVTLGETESAHIRNVLRLRPGDQINVFDGRGSEYSCEILAIGKRSTEVRILSAVEPAAPESPLDFTLASGMLKHDKFDLVIQKSTELGVSRFVPLLTERCDVRMRDTARRMQRWERIIVEASKQCGRSILMKLEEPAEFGTFVQTIDAAGFVFAERGGGPMPADIEMNRVTAIVGPEGGWEPHEVDLAVREGCLPVSLGSRILRAETAAITAAALIQHRYGDLNPAGIRIDGGR